MHILSKVLLGFTTAKSTEQFDFIGSFHIRTFIASVLLAVVAGWGVGSPVDAKSDAQVVPPVRSLVVACVSKATSTLRVSADSSCSYGSEFKLVWSVRGAAPALCINTKSREMTLAYVGQCPFKGTRLARPTSTKDILACADKDSGVLRWPRTGVCWWENTPVKWLAAPATTTISTLPTTTSTTTTSSTTTTTLPTTTVAPPAVTTTTAAPSNNSGSSDTTTTSTTTTTLPDTSAPTVTLARTAATSSSASVSFTITGNEAITCSTLSLIPDSDFALTNISTITSITQTSSTVCTVIAVSTATANGVGVVSTLTAAASFSVTDTAGNAQTTLVGSPQSVTVTRNGEPDAPVISSVTAGNAQVVVVWSAPANNGAAISDYVVQYSTSSSGSYTTFADGTSTSTSATVTGLTNGTAYYFKVAATNSVGTGSNSAASAAATPTLPTQTVTWSPTTALTTAQSPNTPLAASSSGDGAITYAVQSAGATGCAINSSTRVLTFTAAGSCVVRATAATTSNYLTGHIDATFTVTLAAPAFSLSSTIESKTQNVAIAGYTITSTGGTIASYAISPAAPTGLSFSTSTGLLTGTPTAVQSATAYTITATNATGTATATFTLTVTDPTCAMGGACIVGDQGPGGGIVFYVQASGGTFACGATLASRCKYLEAAPTSGTNAWTDAGYAWSGNTTVEIGVTARGTAVGTGYKNTEAMVTQSAGGDTASRAGTIARAYGGPNNLSDWYLPSKDELNELCKYARTQTTGNTTVLCGGTGSIRSGFSSSTYWSSSEFDLNRASYHSFWCVCQGAAQKNNTNYVRPVRAFG